MYNLYIIKHKAPTIIGTLLYLTIVYLVAITIALKSNMPAIASPGVVQLNIPIKPCSNNTENILNLFYINVSFLFIIVQNGVAPYVHQDNL